jgi:hypothetical protein
MEYHITAFHGSANVIQIRDVALNTFDPHGLKPWIMPTC